MSFSAALLMTGWWCIPYQDKMAVRSAGGARHYTNVVTLVLEKLEEMPTRRVCLEQHCLSWQHRRAGDAVPRGRDVGGGIVIAPPAVMAQLIVLTEKAYAFTHDRVQEAAFALLDQRERSHLPDHRQPAGGRLRRQAAGNDAVPRRAPRRPRWTAFMRCSARCSMSSALLGRTAASALGDYHSALSYIQVARALGNAGAVSDFMLDIEEAGCELRSATGANPRAV